MQVTPFQITIWTTAWTALGWFASTFLQHILTKRRERVAGASHWKKELIGFVAEFRTAFVRMDDAGDYVALFNNNVTTLRKLSATIPANVKDVKRARIDEAVTTLCNLSDQEVAYGKGQVASMLKALEDLVRNA